MHLLYYSFIIITSSCQQRGNVVFLRDVLHKMCFEIKDELILVCCAVSGISSVGVV